MGPDKKQQQNLNYSSMCDIYNNVIKNMYQTNLTCESLGRVFKSTKLVTFFHHPLKI
jgi:hypothetical protein